MAQTWTQPDRQPTSDSSADTDAERTDDTAVDSEPVHTDTDNEPPTPQRATTPAEVQTILDNVETGDLLRFDGAIYRVIDPTPTVSESAVKTMKDEGYMRETVTIEPGSTASHPVISIDGSGAPPQYDSLEVIDRAA